MEEVLKMDTVREARLAAIQMLIPLGLEKVEEELMAEVKELCGGPGLPERSYRARTGRRTEFSL